MSAQLHDITVTVNGEEVQRARRCAQNAGRFPARGSGAHRQPCRLRARRVRRLHGARRRRGRARLPDARGAMRRRARRDHRGRVGHRRDRRPAGGVRGAQRAAMRLLHARHAADRAGAADGRRRAEPRDNPRAYLRQLLPLHRLSGDRRCGRSGGAGARARHDMYNGGSASDLGVTHRTADGHQQRDRHAAPCQP